MNANACPICQQEENVRILGSPYTQVDSTQYDCRRCGTFAIEGIAWYELQSLNDTKRPFIAAYTRGRTVRKQEVIMLTTSDFTPPSSEYPIPYIRIGEIISQFPQNISDKLDRALLNLRFLTPYTGATFLIDTKYDGPLLLSDSFETIASNFMFSILEDLGYIVTISIGGFSQRITAKGWERIYQIESTRPNSNVGFIAMAFDPKFDPIWTALNKGIEQAGFKPFRVNQSETNGKICDEIIAQIQRSKFVVADFTDQRKGVYFEAGYAMGLGIPVIWSCNAQEIKDGKLHFDTRQYNHIDWQTPEELTTRLYHRIRVTIQ